MTNAAKRLEEAKRRWGTATMLEGDKPTTPPHAPAVSRKAAARAQVGREIAARSAWVERVTVEWL